MHHSALSGPRRAHTTIRHALGMLAVGVVTVAVLSGCAGTPPEPPETVFVTVKPSAEPTPSATPSATPTPEPAPPAPPAPPAEIEPNAPAEPIVPGPASDLGLTAGAMGPVTAGGDGALLTYTVVSGDAFFDIAQRFDLPQQQLLKMNPSIPSLGTEIYIGQIINLDWTTTR